MKVWELMVVSVVLAAVLWRLGAPHWIAVLSGFLLFAITMLRARRHL